MTGEFGPFRGRSGAGLAPPCSAVQIVTTIALSSDDEVVMTEYPHPGVYVVELEGRTAPIEGVPTSAADLFDKVSLAQLESLARRFEG